MSFVQAKCPECGGDVSVDDSKKAAICQFCGEAFIVQDAINNYNTYNTTNNTFNTDNRATHNYSDGTVVNVYEDINKDFVIEAGVLKEYHGASTDVVIPNGVIEIEKECFKGLKISSVTISDSVTSIGSSAFEGCIRLTSITIPDSVTSIDAEAFYGCTNLTAVTIPKGVTTIGKDVFSNCKSFVSIEVEEDNLTFSSQDGVLFNKDKTFLIKYPVDKIDTNYSIPNNVTHICSDAFKGCTRLTSVTIPDSVTSIGDNAFERTSLSSIIIPDSVTSIGDEAFYLCQKLTSANIPDSVTHIGDGAFMATNLTSIIIPDSVTSVGKDAFYWCFKLFDVAVSDDLLVKFKAAFSIDLYEYLIKRKEEAKRQAKKQAEKEKQIAQAEYRRSMGLCQHCGCTFKGLFTKKCSYCGKEKDY